MKTPIAIHNLWHQGAKTLVSVGGVAFALLLVFMQLGFMGAVSHTATNVLERLDFDVLIRARDYMHLYEPSQIDREWLTLAKSTEGVRSASPFWVTIHNWRKLPNYQDDQSERFESKYLPIAVMAYEPEDRVFLLDDVREASSLLHQDNSILLDDSTQVDYGPWDGRKFSEMDVGRRTEVGGKDFRIDETFKLGTGLAANGALIMGHTGFARITPWDVQTTCSLGLVQVQEGSYESKAEVVQRLRSRAALASTGLSDELSETSGFSFSQFWGATSSEAEGVVEILTREEAFEREKFRWLWQTPIGLIFQLGVLLSLLVGAAIVYMVLSTDVANRLPEYATLLAMGYSRKYLASIVMTQAIVLCGLGFLTAWGVAEVLYWVTYHFSGIPMTMDMGRVVKVSILGLVMCCVSGILALRKLWKAEPASLF